MIEDGDSLPVRQDQPPLLWIWRENPFSARDEIVLREGGKRALELFESIKTSTPRLERIQRDRENRGVLGTFWYWLTGKSGEEKDTINKILAENQTRLGELTLINAEYLHALGRGVGEYGSHVVALRNRVIALERRALNGRAAASDQTPPEGLLLEVELRPFRESIQRQLKDLCNQVSELERTWIASDTQIGTLSGEMQTLRGAIESTGLSAKTTFNELRDDIAKDRTRFDGMLSELELSLKGVLAEVSGTSERLATAATERAAFEDALKAWRDEIRRDFVSEKRHRIAASDGLNKLAAVQEGDLQRLVSLGQHVTARLDWLESSSWQRVWRRIRGQRPQVPTWR